MKRYLVVVLLAAVLVSLLTCLTQVQPGEIAVVRRFGRVLDTRPLPGLYVGLPWGIDRVDRVAVDLVRRVHVGYDPRLDEAEDTAPPGQLLTGDHNLVNVQAVVEYKVIPEEVVDFVVHQDRVDVLVERAVETALAEWVASQEVDHVLLRAKAELPVWLTREVGERLAPYGLGIRVQTAGVTHVYPPRAVQAAFDEVNRAQTAKETEIERARQEAETRWRTAQMEKYDIERKTAAYVAAQLALARAEATSFAARLEKYQRLSQENPYYLNALWWEEMSRLYASMRANGRIDVLDNYLGADGLDITQFPLLPGKK